MKHVPEKLQTYRLEKKYYEATELLKNAGTVHVHDFILLMYIHIQLVCWRKTCLTLRHCVNYELN